MTLQEALIEAQRRDTEGLIPEGTDIGPPQEVENRLNESILAFPQALAKAKTDQASLAEGIAAVMSGVALAQSAMDAVKPFLPLLLAAAKAKGGV